MNKTAVVTGATKGLGRAIAEHFASEGFDVCVCARTQADLDQMQSEWSVRFPGVALLTQRADLSQRTEVFHFADFVRNQWTHLDVLVNNAGIYLPGTISEEPAGTFETLMEANVYSAYHLTRALLPLMLQRRSGHIFNMCSTASIMAHPNGGSYTVSKFALLGFSKALREELKTRGIKVTAVLPGPTWSESWSGVDAPPDRLMDAAAIARIIWSTYDLPGSAVVEELLLRPQLGDL